MCQQTLSLDVWMSQLTAYETPYLSQPDSACIVELMYCIREKSFFTELEFCLNGLNSVFSTT